MPAMAQNECATCWNIHGARCKKSVQLLSEKNVVHAIEMRCSCGEVTVVELEYGPQQS